MKCGAGSPAHDIQNNEDQKHNPQCEETKFPGPVPLCSDSDSMQKGVHGHGRVSGSTSPSQEAWFTRWKSDPLVQTPGPPLPTGRPGS